MTNANCPKCGYPMDRVNYKDREECTNFDCDHHVWRAKPTLLITQWRAYGADHETMTAHIIHDWNAEQSNVMKKIAEDNSLAYSPDEDDQGDHPGDILWIDDLQIKSGDEVIAVNGKKYRVILEAIS